MSFAAQVQADISAVASVSEFAEELLYRPAVGDPFAVTALVARHPLAPTVPAKQSTQSTFELVVPRAALAVVSKGVDKVDVPPTRGAAAVTMRVIDVLGEGLGSWKLKVRA